MNRADHIKCIRARITNMELALQDEKLDLAEIAEHGRMVVMHMQGAVDAELLLRSVGTPVRVAG